MPTATIKIFLVHGDPKRLRTAELSNWNGKALAAPRSELDGILARDESQGSGVYFLTGIHAESGGPAVYIGEAECIRDRIRSHLAKDFWNQIVYFTSKDENLTKSHIRYLEGRLIELAEQAGRHYSDNGQKSGARLPEADRAEMEVFLEKMQQLLPVLGVDVLVPVAGQSKNTTEDELLYCDIKGLRSTGRLTPNGIVVFAKSQAVGSERPASQNVPWLVNQRQRLKDEGALVAEGDHLVFARNVEFASPSAAAAAICGGATNGLTMWKNAKGLTLKELQQ